MTRWRVQIADPAVEMRFRKAQFPSNRRKLIATIMAMLAFSLVVLVHGLYFGTPPIVIAARSANVALMTLAIGLVWRIEGYKALEWAAAISFFVCSGVFTVMIAFVPAFEHVAGTGIVGIVVLAYLMSPVSSHVTALAVSSASLFMIACWLINVAIPFDSLEVIYVILWTINVNCLGYAGCRSRNYWQRIHFCQTLLLEKLSTKDALTDLYNRLHFEKSLDEQWRRAERDRTVLSLVMIDIDYFKRFNDALGHPAGDACLRTVASVLRTAFIDTDVDVVRYGGEEFACILPRTSAVGASQAADRVMKALLAAGIPHPDSPLGPCVTLSIGVATSTPEMTGVADLCAVADRRLYVAKRGGRNRIEAGLSPRVTPVLAHAA